MKRSPLKRKTPMKRGGGLERKPYRWKGRDSLTKKADALFFAKVHASGKCAVGTSFCDGPMEAHYARGRSKRFRWRVDCGLLLCAVHHRTSVTGSAHGSPAAFKAWMENHHPEILAADYPVESAAAAIRRLSQ